MVETADIQDAPPQAPDPAPQTPLRIRRVMYYTMLSRKIMMLEITILLNKNFKIRRKEKRSTTE